MDKLTNETDAQSRAKGKVLVTDKDGNTRYVGRLEAEHLTDSNGNPTEWPVKSGIPKKPVDNAKAKDEGADKPNIPTAAEMIKRLKETTTKEEAIELAGSDERATVKGALAKHLEYLEQTSTPQ